MEKDTKYFIGVIAILIISVVYLNINENLMSSEAIKDISGMAVGDNVALKTAGTTCSVSKVIFGSLPCTNAIDKNINTYWVIGAQKDMAGKYDNYPSNVWIKLTLKEDKWVDKIILKSIIKKAIGYVKNGKLTLVDSNGKIVHEIKNIVVPYGRSVPNGVTVQFKENEYLLNVDESVIINYKKVTLVNVGSGGSIIVGVDGELQTIPASTAKTIKDIKIYNKEISYNDIKSKRSAKVIISISVSSFKIRSAKFEMIQTWGPNAGIAEFEIYEGKAPVQQCTDSDGGKNYDVKGKGIGLYGNAKETGIVWGENPNKCSPRFGSGLDYTVYYDCCFDSETSDQLNEGYCDENGLLSSWGYHCPNGCSNGACIQAATNYLPITIEYSPAEDLARSGYPNITSSERTIKISAPGSERFSFVNNPDIKTSKIWLTKQGSDALLVFYYNPNLNPTIRYLKTIWSVEDLIKVQNGDIITVTSRTPSSFRPVIRYKLKPTNDLIQANFGVKDFGGGNWEINSLGNTIALAESSELELSQCITDEECVIIGIGEEPSDKTTSDGTIIKNPKLNGDSDRVVLEVPIPAQSSSTRPTTFIQVPGQTSTS